MSTKIVIESVNVTDISLGNKDHKHITFITIMAKGMKCPQSNCGYYMLAIDEKEEPKGSYVVYKCRACGFTVRVFEPK